MKTLYECDVCGSQFSSVESAKECETKCRSDAKKIGACLHELFCNDQHCEMRHSGANSYSMKSAWTGLGEGMLCVLRQELGERHPVTVDVLMKVLYKIYPASRWAKIGH